MHTSLSNPVQLVLNLLIDVMDGVLDYPTWYQMIPAFQTSTGDFNALAEAIMKAQRVYKTGLFGTGAFAENQDQPRFASLTSDTAVSSFHG